MLPLSQTGQTRVVKFTLSYDTYTIPDSVDLYYEGQSIYSTHGLVSEAKSVDLSVTLGQSREVQVIINQDGNPDSGTAWVYSVESTDRGNHRRERR